MVHVIDTLIYHLNKCKIKVSRACTRARTLQNSGFCFHNLHSFRCNILVHKEIQAFICIHLEKWGRRAENQGKWDEKSGIGTTGRKCGWGGEKGKIGVLSTTLGDIWENVGDFSKNVGVFSKNVGDFRRIMPWYQGEIKADERRECEGCESKKCKIAVGCAHVRARCEFSTVRRVNLALFYATLSQFWKMEENSKTRSKQEITKRNRAREGRCVLRCNSTLFEK